MASTFHKEEYVKYMIRASVDPDIGAELEKDPVELQKVIGNWQAHNPEGMYFSLTKRELFIVLDAPNEDSFFEALHATWVATKSYPAVSPVATIDQFGEIMERLGMA